MSEAKWVAIWVLITILLIALAIKLRIWTIKRIMNDLKKAEEQESKKFRAESKPLTQQSFEEWKAEKRKQDQGGFVDLDAPIILPRRRSA